MMYHGSHIGVDNETAAMLSRYQTNPVEFNSVLMETLSFVPINLHGC